MFKKILSYLSKACITFTVLVLAFYSFAYSLSAAEQPAMTSKMIYGLFIASVLFTFSSAILQVKALKGATAYIIHCVFCVASAFLVYVIVLGNATSSAGKLVCVIITLLIYAIIMGIRGAIIARKED